MVKICYVSAASETTVIGAETGDSIMSACNGFSASPTSAMGTTPAPLATYGYARNSGARSAPRATLRQACWT